MTLIIEYFCAAADLYSSMTAASASVSSVISSFCRFVILSRSHSLSSGAMRSWP
jgi:hypothetical protein